MEKYFGKPRKLFQIEKKMVLHLNFALET